MTFQDEIAALMAGIGRPALPPGAPANQARRVFEALALQFDDQMRPAPCLSGALLGPEHGDAQ